MGLNSSMGFNSSKYGAMVCPVYLRILSKKGEGRLKSNALLTSLSHKVKIYFRLQTIKQASERGEEASSLQAKAIGEFSSIIQQCVLCNTRGLLAKSQKRDGERKEPCFASNYARWQSKSRPFPQKMTSKVQNSWSSSFLHNFAD